MVRGMIAATVVLGQRICDDDQDNNLTLVHQLARIKKKIQEKRFFRY